MFVLCQRPDIPSFDSMNQAEYDYEIQQKLIVRMRSSGPDWPRTKLFWVSDPSYLVNAQWPQPF